MRDDESSRLAVPLPGGLRVRAAELFVGRDDELAAAARLIANTERGDSAVICFDGEPGIGKTCLAAKVAAKARERGSAVLYGRCDEHANVSYQPLVEALDHFVEYTPAEALRPHLDGLDVISRLIPRLRGRVGSAGASVDSESDAERYLLCGEVASLIGSIASETALVLVVDDLHAADEPTVLMLRQVLERAAGAPLAALLLWRSTEVGDDHPLHALLADLAGRPGVERRSLRGLSQAEVVECADQEIGQAEPRARREVAASVLDRSAGNPLFVRELLRDIAERSDAGATIDDAVDAGAEPLPDSVRAVVRERVRRLGSGARAVLEAAACFGGAFDAPLLAACTDRATDEVEAALDAAREAGLLTDADERLGSLVFVHVLVQGALYEMQPAGRRGHVHRRIAEALELKASAGAVVDPTPVARHWLRALPPDDTAAARWAIRAGTRASAALAPQDAAYWYREALLTYERLTLTGRERCEALLGLGEAQRDLGEASYRETLLGAASQALALGDVALAIRAAVANNRGFASRTGEVDEERLAVLDEVLRITPPGDHRARAQLLATLVAELSFGGDFDRRARVAGEALDAARLSGDAATLSRTLSARFVPLWTPETLDERLADTEEAVRQAIITGSLALQFEAIHWRTAGLIEAARIDEAEVAARRQDELALRLGQPTALWLSTYDRANLALIAGRLANAEELAEAALTIAVDSRQPDALPFYASQIANIRYEQGRLGELQELIAQVVADNPGIPAFRAVLALACVEADLLGDAADLLDAEAVDAFARLPKDVTRMPALAIWADVCARVGDTPTAELLYELLAPWHAHIAFTGVGSWSNVSHVLGRLAARLELHDVAIEHLGEAIECYQRISAPVWLARAQVDEAEVRVARDNPADRARAGELIEPAIRAGLRLGAASVERRAVALSRRLRSLELLGEARHFVRGATGKPAAARPLPVPAEEPRAGNELRCEGDVWLVRRGEVSFRLADRLGLRHLAKLLANPGLEIPALEMVAGLPERAEIGVATENGLSVRPSGSDHAGEILDEQAKREYRERLQGLREDLDEAERFNDPERASRAREEMQFVGSELVGAVGLGGRNRMAGSTAERARVNVTRAIRREISRIAEHDAELGRELGATVRTGAYCCFDPPPQGRPWEIELPR